MIFNFCSSLHEFATEHVRFGDNSLSKMAGTKIAGVLAKESAVLQHILFFRFENTDSATIDSISRAFCNLRLDIPQIKTISFGVSGIFTIYVYNIPIIIQNSEFQYLV